MDKEEPRKSLQTAQWLQDPLMGSAKNRYGWQIANNTLQAVKFTFNSVSINTRRNENEDTNNATTTTDKKKNTATGSVLCEANNLIIRPFERPQDSENTENFRCHHCTDTINFPREELCEMQEKIEKNCARSDGFGIDGNTESTSTIRSIGSFVCRICHNAEHPERLVSACLCKGSLTFVHIYCLEHWISTSGKTKCELCQFQYKTVQTLRYTCLQSLRMWYSHSMSQRALQDDCQMFSLLTLVAFGIVGTILVGIQYYFAQDRRTMAVMARVWTKGWLFFFLFTTFSVYFINVYILAKGQLRPWYRWWQSAREIKLILENRKTVPSMRRFRKPTVMSTNLQNEWNNVSIAEEEVAIGSVYLTSTYADADANDGRRHALVPNSSEGDDDTLTMEINHNHEQQQQQQHSQQLPQLHEHE